MLSDLLDDLIDARNEEEEKKALNALRKVGVDRATAYVMAGIRAEERAKEGEK